MADDDYDDEGGGALPDFLRDPKGIPKRHWRWMIAFTLVGLIGTGFVLARHEATYTASASVLVTSQRIPEDVLPTMISEDPFSRLNAVVGQVMSRQRLIELIEDFDLFAERRDQVLMEDLVGIVRGGIDIQAQEEFANTGRRGGQTARIYHISYLSGDAQTSAAVANRLAALFVEAGIKSRIERSQEISKFLRQELARAEDEMREDNRRISEFNEKYRGELPSELDSNLAKLDRLQQQRQSLRVSITELESQASSTIAAADPDSPAARLAALQSRYRQEISVHTEEHPAVRAIARQIRSLEKEVAEGGVDATASPSTGLVRAQLNANLRSLRRQVIDIEDQIADLDARVEATPKRNEELTALTERATVSREKYLDFLRKVNAADLAQTVESAQQGAQVSIMDRAYPPSSQDQPPMKLATIGILVSLGLGIGIGVLREMLDPVMIEEDQIIRITGAPALGSVARIV